MKLHTLLMGFAFLLLMTLGTGCGDTGCTPPSFTFADASKAARGWAEACLRGDYGTARQYWTNVAEEIGDTQCNYLAEIGKRSAGVQVLSIDEPISFLCMKQVYVTLRRNDGAKGLLLFFAESGSPSPDGVVMMGVLLGAACPLVDTSQPEGQEFFENCFWYKAASSAR